MNKHAQALGRLGGKVKSEAKTKAVRENGKKGGRPKLVNPFEEIAYAGNLDNWS